MNFLRDSSSVLYFYETAMEVEQFASEGDLDADQERAFSAIVNGRNVHVAGKAGVGKSFLLKHLRATLGKDRNLVFLAPSALAASQIGGMTIHSFFGFPVGPLPETFDRWGEDCFPLIRQIELLVIDEISMVRADLFSAVDRIMRTATRTDKPFGGKQICVVGDFHQLPPVVATRIEHEMLRDSFGGAHAFLTPTWRQADFATVMLNIVHRQQDEVAFVEILNTIRNGDIYSPDFEVRGISGTHQVNCIDALNSAARVTCRPDKDRLTTLCMTRKTADLVNQREHATLGGYTYAAQATISGCFDCDKHPTKERLELKVDARVIVIANGCGAINGDQGHVVNVDPESGIVVVQLDSGRQVALNRYVWQNTTYQLEREEPSGRIKITERTVGTFKQFPLLLAYGISVHRSQGLSLGRVHVDLSSRPFCAGQLYVALSRCRSIKTLSISREILPSDVRQDPRVLAFYREVLDDHPDRPFTSALDDFESEGVANLVGDYDF